MDSIGRAKCSRCGEWYDVKGDGIGVLIDHHCGQTGASIWSQSVSVEHVPSTDERIATALERIAVALERAHPEVEQ